MFDLPTLDFLNNQAVLRARQRRSEQRQSVNTVSPEAMPLESLAERLTLGPPSIGVLLDLFEQSEYLQDFVSLVREYLPEQEKQIMLGDRSDRAHRFCQFFSDKYFELEVDMIDGGDDPVAELVTRIPVWPQGMGYEAYHDFCNMPDPMTLLLTLIQNPWLDFGGDENDARIALIEEAARLVGKEIAGKIPDDGWPPAELHRRLDGTKHAAVAAFADSVWHDTGLALLDNDMECELPEWDHETVETLTAQASELREFWANLNHYEEWLMDSTQANFDELLSLLLEKGPAKVPKEQLPMPLVNPLNQQEPQTLMQIFSEEDNDGEEEGENPRFRPARAADIADLTRF